MSKTVRKQVHLPADQASYLKERAERFGVSEAALLRVALNRLIVDTFAIKDPEAWKKELAAMKKRPSKIGRGWTRYDLYE